MLVLHVAGNDYGREYRIKVEFKTTDGGRQQYGEISIATWLYPQEVAEKLRALADQIELADTLLGPTRLDNIPF